MLDRYSDSEALALGLARGGVPVAYELAWSLRLPLDVLVVRKLGVPGQEELAMGAVASGEIKILNDDVLRAASIDEATVERVAAWESAEVLRRERAYREGRPALDTKDRTVILVDDGLATGSSMLAAVRAIRGTDARRIVVAVPVAAADTCDEVANHVDEIVCARTPSPFLSVGSWYDDFTQTSDDEVRGLLAETRSRAD